MDDRLRQAIAAGEYRVDPDAVAAAMIARAHAARVARLACARSEMLVAGDSIEVRCTGSDEGQAFPLEGAA
jgi:hypothetical protein